MANADTLYKSAFTEITHPDTHGRKEVVQTHRLGPLMKDPQTGKYEPVMLTVLEYGKHGNRVYSIEAVDLLKQKTPAGQLVDSASPAITPRLQELVDKLNTYARAYYVEDEPNLAGYDIAFGPKLGLPEISLPMGFSHTAEPSAKELPLGLSLFTGYGQEEKLINIAYAYEQQAGDEIREIPDSIPPLKDEALNAFVSDLAEKAREMSGSRHDAAFDSMVEEMLDACEKAESADENDPYAVYEAGKELAEAYDKVKAILGS